MDKREGYRQILISEEAFQTLERWRKMTPTQMPAARRCGLAITFGPGGEINAAGCGGSCGLIDRILGRKCTTVALPGGIIGCACAGGWWDRIFRS